MAMTREERQRRRDERDAAQQRRVDEWVRRQVAEAPPLGPETVRSLQLLLSDEAGQAFLRACRAEGERRRLMTLIATALRALEARRAGSAPNV